MIIDCHCHAGKGDGLTGPWDTSAPIEAYLRQARAAGIHKTVIFPPFHSDYARANRELARIAARHPGRFICFAAGHASRDAGRLRDMLEQAVRQWGFCGVKVHRLEAPATREVCEAAQALKIPVLYDVVGRAHLVELLASEYPRVNFIVPHLGSFADDWRAHMQAIDQLVRLPNVYADTAGVRRFDYLVQAIKRGGAHKVLFGSDGPWLHPGLELYKIRLLQLPPDEEALVLGRNLLRLIQDARVPSNQERATARVNRGGGFASLV
jgi:predicted TIM-barrel fold metal-dependent hydrolase